MTQRALMLVCLLFVTSIVKSDFEPEFPSVATLPEHGDHQWFWVYGMRAPAQVDSRAFLVDENGRQLGQLSTGFWSLNVINRHTRGDIVTLETYMSRGTRGDRTDVVVLYDSRTLAPTREIIIPPKRINAVRPDVDATLSDDEQFLLVINYTPAQSITIVDLDAGTVVEEVETPGCSVAFAAGARDFYSICGNGSFLHLKLDDAGHVVSRRRTEPLFDAVNDFLTVSASRLGDTWYFVSRDNHIYGITMAGDTIEVAGKWPLTSDSEREDGWMMAGMGHTAVHAASGSLYVLVRQGAPEQFEDPGSAVWVFDTETMDKRLEIPMQDLTVSIAVSQDDKPRLYTADLYIPLNTLATIWMALTEGEASLAAVVGQRANVYDALSGEHELASEPFPHGYLNGVRAW